MGYTIDGLSFTDSDSNIRQKAVERILEHIKVAKVLDAMVIIGSMRGKCQMSKNTRNTKDIPFIALKLSWNMLKIMVS